MDPSHALVRVGPPPSVFRYPLVRFHDQNFILVGGAITTPKRFLAAELGVAHYFPERDAIIRYGRVIGTGDQLQYLGTTTVVVEDVGVLATRNLLAELRETWERLADPTRTATDELIAELAGELLPPPDPDELAEPDLGNAFHEGAAWNETRCDRARRLLGLTGACCGHCHDDEDGGYTRLCVVTHGSVDYEVCCALALEYEIKHEEPHGAGEEGKA